MPHRIKRLGKPSPTYRFAGAPNKRIVGWSAAVIAEPERLLYVMAKVLRLETKAVSSVPLQQIRSQCRS